ncbi:MAG: hypothetical protein CBB71_06700 [Rhodopirellula sp. TMED11]|nr:MAG: hypothetical protein CBB71_06700 [Rhodopirellula sp. TMED11]
MISLHSALRRLPAVPRLASFGSIRRSMASVSAAAYLVLAAAVMAPAAGAVAPKGPNAPKVGQKAPDFELSVLGEQGYLTLSDLNASGTVVVVVLRGFPGYQCPLCRRQVAAYMNRASAFAKELGNKDIRFVMVYPGAEQGLDANAKKFSAGRTLPLPMAMVTDPDMKMVSEWGLRWDAPRETAYPSAFVIGPGRRVLWSKVSKGHGDRATAEDLLAAIRAANKK